MSSSSSRSSSKSSNKPTNGAGFELTKMELAERRVLADIMGILRRHQIPASSIPTLCIVGVQSHGKSSLCEYFVGIPLTLVSEDTGTRCPTKFFLQFDENAVVPQCTIVKVPKEVSHIYPDMSVHQPMSVEYQRLPEALGKVMREVEENCASGFSHDILEVHVVSHLCPSLFFIDLPGVVSEIDPRHETINNIVKGYLKQPSIIPLMVVKASEDMATGLLYGFVNKHAHANWKETSLFIATHFDAKLPKNGRELQKRFESHCSDPQDPSARRVLTKYFVSLNPPPFVDRAALMTKKHSELVDRIRSLDKLEHNMIQQMNADIKRSETPDYNEAHWGKYIGLRAAKSAIKIKWYENYRDQFNVVRAALQKKAVTTQDEIKQLHELKQSFDPVNIAATVSGMITSFVRATKQILDQDAEIWNGTGGFQKAGLTYADESADFQMSGQRQSTWQYELSHNKLEALNLESVGLTVELRAALLGSAQLRRLFNVNRAMLGSCPLPEDTFDTWLNSLKHSGSQPNWAYAVSQVANNWLLTALMPSVEFLAARVHRTFARIGDLAAIRLRSEYPESLHNFIGSIQQTYLEFVSDRVEQVARASRHLIRAKCCWVDPHLAHGIQVFTQALTDGLESCDDQFVDRRATVDSYNGGHSDFEGEADEFDDDEFGEPDNHNNDKYDDDCQPGEVGGVISGDVRRRLAALLSDGKSAIPYPTGRFLSNEAAQTLANLAEIKYFSQMTFVIHDVESLFVSDVERCVEDPSSPDAGGGTSLSSWMNRMICTSGKDLIESMNFDVEKNERDINNLTNYHKQLLADINEAERKKDSLRDVYKMS